MQRDPKDWNYDRLYTAQAQIADVQNDIMRTLHTGEMTDTVRERMCQRLRSAADDVAKTILCHET